MAVRTYKSIINVGGENLSVTVINISNDENKINNIEEIPIHHIQILDRSGSMSNDIDSLIEDCKKTIQQMKQNDYYSVIWFSGANQFRTILKGISKSNNSDESSFRVLDSIKSTIGTTCFSESVEETEKIIEELEALCPNFSITLFTDGQAVTPWSENEEYDRVNKVLERINGKIISFNTIGYGNYCNEMILESWSMYSEFGEFIHSSEIDEYHKIFENNSNRAREVDLSPIDFEILDESCEFFYVTNSSVMKMRNHMNFNHCNRHKNQIIVVRDSSAGDLRFKFNGEEYSDNNSQKICDKWIDGILYRLAYGYYVYGDRYISMKILCRSLMDKEFVDSHVNSFTPDEIEKHKRMLKRAAMYDSSFRHKGTCESNYIPDEYAPCLIDLLIVLVQNKDNCYVPCNDYQRIGVKVTDEFNMFHKKYDEFEDAEESCPISDIIFNEKKLNISIRFKINGYVTINPKQAEKVCLPPNVPCAIYRTHTLVKDGFLNMNKITVYIDNHTLIDLKDAFKNCIISEIPYNQSNNYLVELDLTKIPIINASYGNESIEKVFELVVYENLLKAKLKIAKAFKSEGYIETKIYNEEQCKLLSEYGIKNGIYSGIKNVTPHTEDCDFYMSRTFELSLKGFSSLSAVNIENGIPYIDSKPKNGDMYLYYLIKTGDYKDSINSYKKSLAQVKARLSAIRIAKILTGKWFDELNIKDTKKPEIQIYEGICPITGNKLTLNIKKSYDKTYF